jgi:hypothetical protein
MPRVAIVVIGILSVTAFITALNVDRLYRRVNQIEVRLKIAK